VRRDPHERFALLKRFAHQAQMQIFEIAQAAVNELGGCRRRAAREIILLEQHDGEPAARGIARNPAAVYAAANDRKIVFRLHLIPVPCRVRPGQQLGKAGFRFYSNSG
jgi:hypothetical protein